VNLFYFILAGSAAQLIDGSLGMGFGVTSATILLALGTSAAATSAAVHVAKIGTGLASGIAHWRRDNVDTTILFKIAIPGGIGAFAGATFLSSIDLTGGTYFISTILFLLGLVLLYRNMFRSEAQVNLTTMSDPKYLKFIGLTGGFVDASGGGGWGPVVTPTLLATTKHEPRKVIGTVSAAEFIVAVCASLGFLASLWRLDMNWEAVLGLSIGGILMAPIAARLVGWLPRRVLGTVVAITIIILNGLRLLGVI
jgi:uncharacterized membrane protein YfcA